MIQMFEDPVLECQDCGIVLRTLSPAEAQKVAANPYNYIALCMLCRNGNEQMENGDGR